MSSAPPTVGICGLGQIGLPLAAVVWRSGYSVLCFDSHRARTDQALEGIAKLDDWLNHHVPETPPRYGQVNKAGTIAELNDEADLILECIPEDIEAKTALFASLRPAALRGAIFCTCTSGLSISELGKGCGFPGQLVGTHFWSPPHLMPLVEVVKGNGTTEFSMIAAENFCRGIGKRPVRVNVDAPGFIGNRLLHAMWREAIHIVERGIAGPEAVDLVAKLTIGLRLGVLGPFEHMDLAGLDLVDAIHQYLLRDLAADRDPQTLLRKKIETGCLGVKTGEGFHAWSSERAAALVERRDRRIASELARSREISEAQ